MKGGQPVLPLFSFPEAKFFWHASQIPRRINESNVRRVTWLTNGRSEEHTSELQSLMRISYAVFCLKNKKTILQKNHPSMKTSSQQQMNRTSTHKTYTY